MAIILVDVDLVVAPSDIVWWNWLNYKAGTSKKMPMHCDYNLSVYFPEVATPYSFWEARDLYDDMEPIKGSIKSLTSLDEMGHTILFASYCKKGHFGSKYDWCKRHFPFMEGFYATKEKGYIKADYFIDDRHNFLNQKEEDCTLIKYDTRYTQSEALLREVEICASWDEVTKVIKIKEGEV